MSVYSGRTGNVPAGSTYGDNQPWHRWQDWVNLILGIILFIAPWFWRSSAPMASTATNAADMNAWIMGVIVAILSLCALAAPRASWPEWLNAIAGIWLFISPWVLGLSYVMRSQMSANWVIGIIVFILACWAGASVGRSRTVTTA